MGPGVT